MRPAPSRSAWLESLPHPRKLIVLLALAAVIIPSSVIATSARAGHGLLTVVTSPTVDAPISVDGIVRNTSAIERLELPVGDHEICFGSVPDHLTPPCEVAEITEGSVTEIVGEYTAAGTLSITTEPVAGGVIVDGVERDQAPAAVLVAEGSHEVCFSELTGYTTPACTQADVAFGQTVDVTATYTAVATETPEPAAYANLLTADQESFESSISGWTPQGNTTLAPGSPGSVGEKALVVKVDASGPWPDKTRTARAGTPMGKKGIPVTVGHSYRGWFDVRPLGDTPPSEVRCELRWFRADGKILSTYTGAAFASEHAGSFVTPTCEAQAPDRAAFASLRVYITDADYGESHLLDNAWLVDLDASPTSDPSPEPSTEPTSGPTTEPTADPTTEPTTDPTTDPASGSGPIPPGSTNLLSPTQQDLESGTSGWVPQGNTTVAWGQPGSTGSRSLEIHVDASGPWPDATRTARVGTTTGSSGVPVTPGHVYRGAFDIQPSNGSAPSNVRCELRWYDSGGRIISTYTGGRMVAESSSAWVTTSCESAAPSGSVAAGLRAYIEDADYGETHLLDNAWLVDLGGTTPAPEPEPTSEPSPTPTSEPSPTPTSEPVPAPADWKAAFDSRDQTKVDAWYRVNTGYQALGYAPSDLLELPTPLDITPAWLIANEDGTHVYRANGRWFIDGVRLSGYGYTTTGAFIRFNGVSNVTLRGCWLDPDPTPDSDWGKYGVQGGGSSNVVEFCDIDGNNNAGVAFVVNPGGSPGNFTVRNNNVHHWRVGFQGYNGVLYEYNWFHTSYYFSGKHGNSGGSHNTSGSIRGSNAVYRRNHADDGNSAAISLYANDPIENVLVEENVMNTANAYYCFNFGSKTYADSTLAATPM